MRSWLSLVITSNGARPGSRRYRVHVHVHAHPAPGGRLARSARDPGAAEVLDPETKRLSSSSRVASMRRFSSNGSPTWTPGRLAAPASGHRERSRGQDAHPADPSRPVVTKQHRQVPLTQARPSTRRSSAGAAAQDVDEWVARVTLRELKLTAYGRDPDCVAVARDAAHYPLATRTVLWVVGRAKRSGSISAIGRRHGKMSRISRRPRWRLPGRARSPRDGCGFRCGSLRRSCRRRRSPRVLARADQHGAAER